MQSQNASRSFTWLDRRPKQISLIIVLMFFSCGWLIYSPRGRAHTDGKSHSMCWCYKVVTVSALRVLRLSFFFCSIRSKNLGRLKQEENVSLIQLFFPYTTQKTVPFYANFNIKENEPAQNLLCGNQRVFSCFIASLRHSVFYQI